VFEGLTGDVALQATDDFSTVESFASTSFHVVACLGVVAHPGEDDAVEGGVGLAVSASIESIPGVDFP
jgi:hypothetical protein